MQFISLIDFLIAPIYVFILYLLIKSKAIKYRADGLSKYFITAFFLHMIGGILYAMVIQYYYGYGDSFGFFLGSNFITDISKDEFTIKYFFTSSEQLSKLFLSSQTGNEVVGNVMDNDANLMIMKISAAFSFLSFNRYLIITLFFSLFSFGGLWRLYTTFNEVLKNKTPSLLAITVLYTPSIWFWGSGLIKDSICMGCLGFTVNALYKIFISRKFSFTDILILVVCFYGLFVIKSYIAAALILATFIFSIHYFIKTRNSVIEKWIYSIVIFTGGALVISFALQSYINTLIEDSKTAIDTFKNAYENFEAAGEAGSGFSGKTFDFTTGGIILRSPANLFTTLYRPFLWETRNIMMVFSGLESFVALIAFIYLLFKTRFKFFIYAFSDPFILFALTFVVILSITIGFTTFNFGTMVRYRIPVLPFYSFVLIGVYLKFREQKAALG